MKKTLCLNFNKIITYTDNSLKFVYNIEEILLLTFSLSRFIISGNKIRKITIQKNKQISKNPFFVWTFFNRIVIRPHRINV